MTNREGPSGGPQAGHQFARTLHGRLSRIAFPPTQITGHRQSPITQPGPKKNKDRACVTTRTGNFLNQLPEDPERQEPAHANLFVHRHQRRGCAQHVVGKNEKNRRHQRNQHHADRRNRQQFPAERRQQGRHRQDGRSRWAAAKEHMPRGVAAETLSIFAAREIRRPRRYGTAA